MTSLPSEWDKMDTHDFLYRLEYLLLLVLVGLPVICLNWLPDPMYWKLIPPIWYYLMTGTWILGTLATGLRGGLELNLCEIGNCLIWPAWKLVDLIDDLQGHAPDDD
jgi:hypothetical protein